MYMDTLALTYFYFYLSSESWIIPRKVFKVKSEVMDQYINVMVKLLQLATSVNPEAQFIFEKYTIIC